MSEQSTPPKPSRGLRPKTELLIILVFFLCFIIWAVSKCSSSGVLTEQLGNVLDTPQKEEVASVDSSTITNDPYGGTPLSPPANPPTGQNPSSTPQTNSTSTISTTVSPSATRSILYITIDGLNMRTGPNLDSTVILKLSLYEEVSFMNEVTDSTEQISLGHEVADEPWVKIKHKSGRIGWVYGAGVNYYRKKRQGVLE